MARPQDEAERPEHKGLLGHGVCSSLQKQLKHLTGEMVRIHLVNTGGTPYGCQVKSEEGLSSSRHCEHSGIARNKLRGISKTDNIPEVANLMSGVLQRLPSFLPTPVLYSESTPDSTE